MSKSHQKPRSIGSHTDDKTGAMGGRNATLLLEHSRNLRAGQLLAIGNERHLIVPVKGQDKVFYLADESFCNRALEAVHKICRTYRDVDQSLYDVLDFLEVVRDGSTFKGFSGLFENEMSGLVEILSDYLAENPRVMDKNKTSGTLSLDENNSKEIIPVVRGLLKRGIDDIVRIRKMLQEHYPNTPFPFQKVEGLIKSAKKDGPTASLPPKEPAYTLVSIPPIQDIPELPVKDAPPTPVVPPIQEEPALDTTQEPIEPPSLEPAVQEPISEQPAVQPGIKPVSPVEQPRAICYGKRNVITMDMLGKHAEKLLEADISLSNSALAEKLSGNFGYKISAGYVSVVLASVFKRNSVLKERRKDYRESNSQSRTKEPKPKKERKQKEEQPSKVPIPMDDTPAIRKAERKEIIQWVIARLERVPEGSTIETTTLQAEICAKFPMNGLSPSKLRLITTRTYAQRKDLKAKVSQKESYHIRMPVRLFTLKVKEKLIKLKQKFPNATLQELTDKLNADETLPKKKPLKLNYVKYVLGKYILPEHPEFTRKKRIASVQRIIDAMYALLTEKPENMGMPRNEIAERLSKQFPNNKINARYTTTYLLPRVCRSHSADHPTLREERTKAIQERKRRTGTQGGISLIKGERSEKVKSVLALIEEQVRANPLVNFGTIPALVKEQLGYDVTKHYIEALFSSHGNLELKDLRKQARKKEGIRAVEEPLRPQLSPELLKLFEEVKRRVEEREERRRNGTSTLADASAAVDDYTRITIKLAKAFGIPIPEDLSAQLLASLRSPNATVAPEPVQAPPTAQPEEAPVPEDKRKFSTGEKKADIILEYVDANPGASWETIVDEANKVLDLLGVYHLHISRASQLFSLYAHEELKQKRRKTLTEISDKQAEIVLACVSQDPSLTWQELASMINQKLQEIGLQPMANGAIQMTFSRKAGKTLKEVRNTAVTSRPGGPRSSG